MIDRYGRKLNYLRISVTDCCNLKCIYCMPPSGSGRCYEKTAAQDLLTDDEILLIAAAAAEKGVERVRITGGEPLLRPGLEALITKLKDIPGIKKTALTTNGILLGKHAENLAEAGLDSISISLDTVRHDRYEKITGSAALDNVLSSIDKALDCGIPEVKINTVLVDGYNDDEVEKIAAMAVERPLSIRFIELMPIGWGGNYTGIDCDIIKARLENRFGKSMPVKDENNISAKGPARYITFGGFEGKIGFISPLSHSFCQNCNRIRITADGKLRLCLGHEDGTDLRQIIRLGADRDELGRIIENAVWDKPVRHDFSVKDSKEKDNTKMPMFTIGG